MKNKIKLFFDDTIFAIQKVGGVSIVFNLLIHKCKDYKNIETFIIEYYTEHNSFYDFKFKKIYISHIFFNSIIQFIPITKILPRNSIFHSTYYRYSLQKNIKKVLTIHDLTYEHGYIKNKLKSFLHIIQKKIAIKNSDFFVCVSENTKNDFEKYYSKYLINKKIFVIHNSIPDLYFTYKPNNIIRNKNKILYVGSRAEYKNFDMLVLALEKLQFYHLHIVGGQNLTNKEIHFLNKHIKNRYYFDNNLSTYDLINNYYSSFCLIYPSSYEGFGLPLIEAMACECPVITSKHSCIPEIVTDCAFLLEDISIQYIIDSIITISNNEFLVHEIINKAKLRAATFTLKNQIKKYINFYEFI